MGITGARASRPGVGPLPADCFLGGCVMGDGERRMRKGIGGHQGANMRTDEWITPKYIIDSLGTFELDPCSSVNQPWETALKNYTIFDNGLLKPWSGRVWLNPPYGNETIKWIKRLALHNNGIALIFARTETKMFFEWVWPCAKALLFIEGRLTFYHPDGTKAKHNSGAPSVLIAYGKDNADKLSSCEIDGAYIEP